MLRENLYEVPNPMIPFREMAHVGAVVTTPCGTTDILMREQELAKVPVERKAVNSVPAGIHQHGAGAVHYITGQDLLGTRA